MIVWMWLNKYVYMHRIIIKINGIVVLGYINENKCVNVRERKVYILTYENNIITYEYIIN